MIAVKYKKRNDGAYAFNSKIAGAYHILMAYSSHNIKSVNLMIKCAGLFTQNNVIGVLP